MFADDTTSLGSNTNLTIDVNIELAIMARWVCTNKMALEGNSLIATKLESFL
jgi:hypothetical protein